MVVAFRGCIWVGMQYYGVPRRMATICGVIHLQTLTPENPSVNSTSKDRSVPIARLHHLMQLAGSSGSGSQCHSPRVSRKCVHLHRPPYLKGHFQQGMHEDETA